MAPTASHESGHSSVSIIVPCYNEAGTITGLLQSITAQTYPTEHLEIIVVDGRSTDGTRELVRDFAQTHPGLRVDLIDNPIRSIPAALNQGIQHSKGEVIVRLDAHSVPDEGYVRRSLEVLQATGAANVGGVWDILPSADTWIARAIAAAAAHPLGAGDARYRISGPAGEVDTVPFGAFRREWYDRIGPFNESLPTNEDYEFNVRLRQAGGTVWFDPSIRSAYFARSNLRDLARQYARYGFWKSRMLRSHPDSLRWRQAIPPLFVLALLLLGVISPFSITGRLFLALSLVAYVLVTVVAGMTEAVKRREPGQAGGFPLAIWTIHFAWGSAFLWGFISALFEGGRRARRA